MFYLIRARFLLPISDSIGRDKRIADGYVLYENGKIIEVGQYNDEVGQRLIKSYSPDRKSVV